MLITTLLIRVLLASASVFDRDTRVSELESTLLAPLCAHEGLLAAWRERAACAGSEGELEELARSVLDEFASWSRDRDLFVSLVAGTQDLVHHIAEHLAVEKLPYLSAVSSSLSQGVQSHLLHRYSVDGHIDWITLIADIQRLPSPHAHIQFLLKHWPSPTTGYSCGFMRRALRLLRQSICGGQQQPVYPWGYKELVYMPGQGSLYQALVNAEAIAANPVPLDVFFHESLATIRQMQAGQGFRLTARGVKCILGSQDYRAINKVVLCCSQYSRGSGYYAHNAGAFAAIKVFVDTQDESIERSALISELRNAYEHIWMVPENRESFVEGLAMTCLEESEIRTIVGDHALLHDIYTFPEDLMDHPQHGRRALERMISAGMDAEDLERVERLDCLALSALYCGAEDDFIQSIFNLSTLVPTPGHLAAAIKLDRSAALVEFMVKKLNNCKEASKTFLNTEHLAEKYLSLIVNDRPLLKEYLLGLLSGQIFDEFLLSRVQKLRKVMALARFDDLHATILNASIFAYGLPVFTVFEETFKKWDGETKGAIVDLVINAKDSIISQANTNFELFLDSITLESLLQFAMEAPCDSPGSEEFQTIFFSHALGKFGLDAVLGALDKFEDASNYYLFCLRNDPDAFPHLQFQESLGKGHNFLSVVRYAVVNGLLPVLKLPQEIETGSD